MLEHIRILNSVERILGEAKVTVHSGINTVIRGHKVT